jgi:hypothetical protein
VQRLFAINYQVLTLLGSALIVVGAIQWFRDAHLRRLRSSERELLP